MRKVAVRRSISRLRYVRLRPCRRTGQAQPRHWRAKNAIPRHASSTLRGVLASRVRSAAGESTREHASETRGESGGRVVEAATGDEAVVYVAVDDVVTE